MYTTKNKSLIYSEASMAPPIRELRKLASMRERPSDGEPSGTSAFKRYKQNTEHADSTPQIVTNHPETVDNGVQIGQSGLLIDMGEASGSSHLVQKLSQIQGASTPRTDVEHASTSGVKNTETDSTRQIVTNPGGTREQLPEGTNKYAEIIILNYKMLKICI
jgi:hypothetical protein